MGGRPRAPPRFRGGVGLALLLAQRNLVYSIARAPGHSAAGARGDQQPEGLGPCQTDACGSDVGATSRASPLLIPPSLLTKVPVANHRKARSLGYTKAAPLLVREKVFGVYLGHSLNKDKAMQPLPENPGSARDTGAVRGHHAHGTHHRGPPSKEELAFAACLMGAVAFVMAIFYLVNAPDPAIRRQTWQTLNMTVSIFCAVMIYNIIKRALMLFVPSGERWQVTFTLLLYLAIFMFTQVFLYTLKAKEKKWWLLAAGTILAHISGFSAMYGFAGLQALAPISDSLLSAILLAVAAAIWVLGLEVFAGWARLKFARATHHVTTNGHIDEDEEHWAVQVEEVENDVVSLSIGFLLMQVVRFAITSKLQPYLPHDEPEDITQFQANLLLGCSGFFALLTVLGTFLVQKVLSQADAHLAVDRFVRAFQNVNAMAFAFCFLFWAEWQVYALGYHGVRIKAVLLVALFVTALCLVLIFVLDIVEDLLAMRRAVRSLVLAMGLLIGFSWEKAFDLGLEALANPDNEDDILFHEGGSLGEFLAIVHVVAPWILPTFLLCVTLPAWKLYVLPHCDPDQIKAEEDEEDREDKEIVNGRGRIKHAASFMASVGLGTLSRSSADSLATRTV